MSDVEGPLDQCLDQISSPRSSNAAILAALTTLEQLLARSAADEAYKHTFMALQLTFQYNCSCRLLPYLASSTLSLQQLANHGVIDTSNYEEIETISSNVYLALCLVQGLALNHSETKAYLGKPHALQTLLDLLLVSRHLPVSKSSPQPPLTSCVLDTLLCVLVDLPPSLRAFETSNGLQVVVKILKRAGTPREVRMKCLEFLYFYLLDETTDAVNQRKHKRSASLSTNMTTMSTPSLLYSPAPTTAAPSPRTPQHPSTPFPKKPPRIFTPPTQGASKLLDPDTPSSKHRKTPAHLLILNRPVDFVPLSPKKPRAHEQDDTLINETEFLVDTDDDTYNTGVISPTRRTTEEKKELLGCLLGNVDALVEGVRKAGVWGLG